MSKVTVSAQIRSRNRAYAGNLKMERGCAQCGYRKHPCALQFHHLDPSTKKFTIGRTNEWSINMLASEIAKCIVLCANCHAVLEAEKRANG